MRGLSELKPIDQAFHFIFGPADYSDRYRVAVLQNCESRLSKDSCSNILVEVFAHKISCSHRNLIWLFVGSESLCFGDLSNRPKVLDWLLQSRIRGRRFGRDQN